MVTWYVGLRQGGYSIIEADEVESLDGELVFYKGEAEIVVAIVPSGNWTHVKHKADCGCCECCEDVAS